jgi:quercetin dioxygenase-like cupin family protein
VKVISKDSTAARPVTEEGAQGVQIQVLINEETGAPTFAMRHFTVDPGGHTPYHAHDWEHEVYILEGEGEVVGASASIPFREGCAVFVPPGEIHQFRNTGQRPLRFLCMIPLRSTGAPAATVQVAAGRPTQCG